MLRYFLLFFILLALDLSSKAYLFSQAFTDWPMTSFFSVTLVKNTGVAFGLAQDWVGWILLSNLLLFAIVCVFFYQENIVANRYLWVALLAGGLGNMYDRFVLGYVRDFLHFHLGSYSWPVFNFADSYVCLAVMIFVLRFYLQNKKARLCSYE